MFKVGDIVKIIGDRTNVEELQNIYGIWNDAMIEVRHCKCSCTPNLVVTLYLCVSVCVSVQTHQSLGQIGSVTEILNPVVLEVLINGKKQTYVALCLLHAPGERISELHITQVNYIIKAATAYSYVHYS